MVKKVGSSTSGAEKVKCAICGHAAHVLLAHLRDEHSMTGLQYAEEHPGAPLFSKIGAEVVKARVGDAAGLAVPDREVEEVTLEDLMGWKGEVKMKCRRFVGDAPWIPAGNDTGYQYDYDTTLALLFGLHRPTRNSIWIAGYAGTGKTRLVLNVCRRLGREVLRVNLDSSITRSDLIGDWSLRGGETKFKYGLLPQAMIRGAVLLLDEYDLGNPYVVALFRPVLEEHPRLVILENGGEVITPHPEFRVVATANTFGSGDDTGLYGTTQNLSLADRQRFSLFIQTNYLPPEAEVSLLTSAVEGIEEDEASMMVQVASKIRDLFKEKKIEESISPRQLVNWAEVFNESGNALVAANMTFLLPLSNSTQMAIRQLIEESGLVKKE